LASAANSVKTQASKLTKKFVEEFGMIDWRSVWEDKGRLMTTNLLELDGFENTCIQPYDAATRIKHILEIADNDFVLEVGCGAGMIARYMTCRYLGIDYSLPLLRKMAQLLGKEVLNADASCIPLKDKSVDKIYVYSVFHYFPNTAYARSAIDELKRISRKAIVVGDLPIQSHSADHLLYQPSFFPGWEITEGFYNPDRFNAFIKLP
jgi:SAM-dependent methyltransferase